ncbi:MAG: BamA/TamA family outer membrane protein [Bacteroidales bacterium]
MMNRNKPYIIKTLPWLLMVFRMRRCPNYYKPQIIQSTSLSIPGLNGIINYCCRSRISGLAVLLVLFITQLLSVSCTGLRQLEEDQRLYTGSRIRIEKEEPVPDINRIEAELEEALSPEPNMKLLIPRPRLWIHNVMGETGERGLDNWIQTTFGRPPVLFEDVDPERTASLIQNRLFNTGHFDAEVDYQLKELPRRTSVDYRISLKSPYRIRNIFDLEEEIQIAEEINQSLEESILDSNRIYRLEDLRNERDRIDRYLKERGYYYFHPDYLIFMADSTAENRMVDLYMRIKTSTPSFALNKFSIRNTYINISNQDAVIIVEQDRAAENDESPGHKGSKEIREGVFIISGQDFLKPYVLDRAIFLEKDRIYKNRERRRTINHLMGLEVFRFVNINFERAGNDNGNHYLDAKIVLIPMKKKSLSAELRGVSKSNDFAGPGLTGTFTNRNFLGGAEEFSISIDGSFETLMGQKGVNSTEAGISSELRIPRLVPFRFAWISPELIPATRMSLSFNYLNRTDAFSLGSFRSEFGYMWNSSIRTRQRLTPFVFNVFGLGTVAEEYKNLFDRDALLRRGLFEQFILGSQYSFLSNSQLDGIGNEDWYINLNFDVAGNSLWLLSNYLDIGQVDEEGDRRFLGQGFSQYSKADLDLRYYVNTGSNSRLATRFIAGIGVPYGNSTTLPYTRQFTIGGTTSIRAFHPRRLGPGSYTPPEELLTAFNIYQAGEIKLEMNMEFRYAFGNIVKGAIFADAGNIWNLKEDEEVPGGKFRYPEFMEEIALGTGLGLRLDFTFFLLRLDLAFPLADPRYYTGNYFQPVRPLDPEWRRDNLVFNLAIGYPF